MPRTPLLTSLRSTFQDLRRARATGVPVDELRAMRAERPPTRRAMLFGGAAAATVLALPRRSRASGNQPSIGIVGGGIAGLTCALTLADAGVEATVYEASGRAGGRMFSNRTGYWSANQISEWGGELIDTGHRTIRRLAQRFGLPLDNVLKAQPKKSHDTYRVGGGYYSKADVDADFAAILEDVLADLDAAGYPTQYDEYTAAGAALDQMSVSDWIDARVPGGRTAPLGQILDLAYAIEYGADTTDQSALNILYLLAFQPNTTELAIFGESDEAFKIRGGNQQLPEAIADELSALEYGERLVEIKETSGGRYRLTFSRGSTTHEVTHDYVVLAVPFAVLDQVDLSQAGFDDLKLEAIAEQGRGHNGKLQLQFDARGWLGTGPWPGKANGSSYSDTGYQASWEVTRAQAGTPGILVLYSGGSVTDAMRTNAAWATATNNRVVQDAQDGLTQLAPVFPDLSWNGKATQSLPHKSDLFRASYSYYRVGQYTSFAGHERKRQGGVLFCGEHTSTDFQGFMEGGASEGEAAAEKLLTLIE